MTNREFRFNVDLRLRELFAFQAFMLLFRMRLWLLVAIYIVVDVYFCFQLMTGAAAPSEAIKPAAFMFGIPLALVAVILFSVKRNYESVWKPQLPISYVFNEEGVTNTVKTSSSRIAWQGIEEVKIWGGLLLLFLNRHQALIIPKRCLGERFDEFLEYITQRT